MSNPVERLRRITLAVDALFQKERISPEEADTVLITMLAGSICADADDEERRQALIRNATESLQQLVRIFASSELERHPARKGH